MGPSNRQAYSLDVDELELRAMLMATILENLHPVAHRFITPEFLDALIDTIYAYMEKVDESIPSD